MLNMRRIYLKLLMTYIIKSLGSNGSDPSLFSYFSRVMVFDARVPFYNIFFYYY